MEVDETSKDLELIDPVQDRLFAKCSEQLVMNWNLQWRIYNKQEGK